MKNKNEILYKEKNYNIRLYYKINIMNKMPNELDEKTKEERSAKAKLYYQMNKEKILQRMKNQREQQKQQNIVKRSPCTPEQNRKYQKKYLSDPEKKKKHQELKRAWYLKNKEAHLLKCKLRYQMLKIQQGIVSH